MYRPAIILASTSRYRHELLSRLRLTFTCVSPGVDETELPGEEAESLARRLACLKARAIRCDTAAVVIGSDQVAVLDGQQLAKPGNRANAIVQLRAASGREVAFHTAVCIRDLPSGREDCRVDTTRVKFRRLPDSLIERYVDAEQPYDCAGSAKSEGLGIALIERIETKDPTGLIGLPLILLTTMLEEAGVHVL